MKKTYKEFLEAIDIIDEKSFNELMDHLPDVDIKFDFGDLYASDYNDLNEVAKCIINTLLDDFSYVYIDFIDTSNYTIELDDVQSIQDLEDIKNLLSGWNITNYEDILTDIKESENDALLDKKRIRLQSMIWDLPEELIDDLLKQYDER